MPVSLISVPLRCKRWFTSQDFNTGKQKDSDLNANQLGPCTADHKTKKIIKKKEKKKLGKKKLHLVQKTVASPINNTSCQENIILIVLCVLAFCPTTDSPQGASELCIGLAHTSLQSRVWVIPQLAEWRIKCTRVKNTSIHKSRILLQPCRHMNLHQDPPK